MIVRVLGSKSKIRRVCDRVSRSMNVLTLVDCEQSFACETLLLAV